MLRKHTLATLSLTAGVLLGVGAPLVLAQDPPRRQPAADADDEEEPEVLAPATIRSVGTYKVSTGGTARLDMDTATKGTLRVGSRTFAVTGDPTSGKLTGAATGDIIGGISGAGGRRSAALSLTPVLKGKKVSGFTGKIAGKAVTLTRHTRDPIPDDEKAQSDPGPQGSWREFFDAVPDYKKIMKDAGVDPDGKMFWYNFGPVFYRGRLDGTARIMVIASDPGPEECLPFIRRPMVGDAGQRVQGFLAKLGINKSYILVNAYAYAMRPSFVKKDFGTAILEEDFTHVAPPRPTLNATQMAEIHKITVWRHEFFTRVARSSKLEAIVPMGGNAKPAYSEWIATLPANDPIRKIPVIRVNHPSAIDRDQTAPRPDASLVGWNKAVTKLRGIVKPDPGQSNTGPNYGEYFTENDYARVPRWDLPKETPEHIGHNATSRQTTGLNNDAKRPSPDDFKTLVYTREDGKKIKYVFQDGKFRPELTTDDRGNPVRVGPNGIPTE